MTFVLGFGAMVLVGPDAIKARRCRRQHGRADARRAARRTPFLGFIAAVAFATILAVVAGLDALGRGGDLARPLGECDPRRDTPKPGEELARGAHRDHRAGRRRDRARHRVQGAERRLHGRAGLRDRRQRELPGAGARVFWRRTSTAGAASSMAVGTISTLALIALSPAVQVDLLHHATAIFPLKNPALVTIPLSFLTGIWFRFGEARCRR